MEKYNTLQSRRFFKCPLRCISSQYGNTYSRARGKTIMVRKTTATFSWWTTGCFVFEMNGGLSHKRADRNLELRFPLRRWDRKYRSPFSGCKNRSRAYGWGESASIFASARIEHPVKIQTEVQVKEFAKLLHRRRKCNGVHWKMNKAEKKCNTSIDSPFYGEMFRKICHLSEVGKDKMSIFSRIA